MKSNPEINGTSVIVESLRQMLYFKIYFFAESPTVGFCFVLKVGFLALSLFAFFLKPKPDNKTPDLIDQ